MRTTSSLFSLWIILGTFCAGQLAGCNREPIQIATEFQLDETLGVFEVEAGVPSSKRGTGLLPDTQLTIGSGSLEIDPSVITITPADPGGNKGLVNLQQADIPLIVTVWIASVDLVDTVCDVGEQYGPFEVALDENFDPLSVSPPKVLLTRNTLSLINEGEFSLCIEVVSPVDGTVEIESFAFNLGL